MIGRKDALLLAATGLLACAGSALGDAAPRNNLPLDPTVITANEKPQAGPITMGLEKAGLGRLLSDNQIKVYGWAEGGYTTIHRH